MEFERKFSDLAKTACLLGASICVGSAAPGLWAQSVSEVAPIVARSIDRGSAPQLEQSNVTVHLKLRDEEAFNHAIDELYRQGSPTYHQWMTHADFARFAPNDEEVSSVQRELVSHGLTILGIDEHNFSIRARGTTGQMEHAFQTQIHLIEYQGKKTRANVTAARLTGAAGDLVDSITGLTAYRMQPQWRRPLDMKTGKPIAGIDLKQSAAPLALSDSFTNNCFGAPETEYLTTNGQAVPVGLFTGNTYEPQNLSCAWDPKELEYHYGLSYAYSKGMSGAGQTIVVIDGPTNSDYSDDLSSFAAMTGLPGITSSNYKVVFPDGVPSPLAEEEDDVTPETQLDIQWSHAIAPKAKIDLLILPSLDWDEFEYAISYTIAHKLGNVISISYGAPEGLFGAQTVKGFESVLKVAAASGVAVNIASGDNGDDGTGSPNAGGDSYPAASLYATSVGGTSIGIPGKSGPVEVGWGNNVTLLSDAQDAVLDPLENFGFSGGAGGGESLLLAKPAWQSELPGTGRQQPDIAALADPNTGVIIVVSGFAYPAGGTSLSAPIFSGIWALANQAAGESLGQAAPMLPKLLTTIHDVVPVSSSTNVSGKVTDYQGSVSYTAAELVPPLYTTTNFYSALWDASGQGLGAFADLSFGTDTSLTVTKGWDNVTGYGIPNGYGFILAAAALK